MAETNCNILAAIGDRIKADVCTCYCVGGDFNVPPEAGSDFNDVFTIQFSFLRQVSPLFQDPLFQLGLDVLTLSRHVT